LLLDAEWKHDKFEEIEAAEPMSETKAK